MSNPPIEHVIVLMLENRSFDHMCGYWDRLPSGSGLTGEEFNCVDPADTSTAKIFVHRKKLDPEQRDQPEPGHYLENALVQLFGLEAGPYPDPAPMNGFVKDYIETLAEEPRLKRQEEIDPVEAGKELMGCYDAMSTPVLRTLAEEFVLCDRWFSSVPGPTWPNRYYLHAATSDGIADNKKRLPESVPLIYDHLEQAGIPWSVYASEKLTSNVGFALEKFSLFLKPELHSGPYRKEPFFKDIKDFRNDLMNGELPGYSFLEPIFLSMGRKEGTTSTPSTWALSTSTWVNTSSPRFMRRCETAATGRRACLSSSTMSMAAITTTSPRRQGPSIPMERSPRSRRSISPGSVCGYRHFSFPLGWKKGKSTAPHMNMPLSPHPSRRSSVSPSS